ncbi:hypothetical protein CesoFtcFv8_005997 [Champsocephalus esox]|uniref:Uncharacterized protein n=1 Tax=Champsocephalus esox TaxID=159716 RepID=A0AAN8H6M5_9TELE|nr:hypothetical protein CesoFtcFv8_005997 [Champsocephalus esox]
MTGRRQMASFMWSHERSRVKERVRGKVPKHTTTHTTTPNDSLPTPTHCLAKLVPHMAPVAQLLALT